MGKDDKRNITHFQKPQIILSCLLGIVNQLSNPSGMICLLETTWEIIVFLHTHACTFSFSHCLWMCCLVLIQKPRYWFNKIAPPSPSISSTTSNIPNSILIFRRAATHIFSVHGSDFACARLCTVTSLLFSFSSNFSALSPTAAKSLDNIACER